MTSWPTGMVRITVGSILLSLLFFHKGAPMNAADPPKDASSAAAPGFAREENNKRYGAGVQRTMTLLATSRPEKRNTVRILFYGQSITEQSWWKAVADDLRRRFPHANLRIENRAIGGFSAQLLVKTAEADLYPFYPDLLIFHVYGDHRDYERIIANVRERTTAEILMATDHITQPEEIDEETDAAKLTPAQWSAWMNHVFLPETARKYGAELANVREGWRTALKKRRIEPEALLSDTVHLNDDGCKLMAELILRHLRVRPELSDATWRDRIRTVRVGAGEECRWIDGRLRLEFEGNRVDLIADPVSQAGRSARVLIDGRKPSEFPELYTFTRSSGYPGIGWPGLMRVSRAKPLVLEEWTARVFDASDDLKRFRFRVTGSVTGPDGEGDSETKFVSKSGRLVINPDDWSIARSREQTGQPMPEGYEVKWSVVPLFRDLYDSPKVEDQTRETVVTVALGLRNGAHVLELVANGDPPPIRAIRVYRPAPPAQ